VQFFVVYKIRKIMTSSYKIAVIGGTGKSGSYLIQELFSNNLK
jgi:nucleoside-diphosphate-sugar epimerase